MNKLSIVFIGFIVFIGAITGFAVVYASPANLIVIANVIEKYSHVVQHMSSDEMAHHIASGQESFIFDVRESDEYEVSRIPGAVRISPNAQPDELINLLPESEQLSSVVFYCSIGVRSSRLAERSLQALNKQGIKHVYNLKGGIFHWHNEQRLLEDDQGPTELIHPFDSFWGKFVSRRDLIVQ